MRRTRKDCERITERLADLTGIAFELEWLTGRAMLLRPALSGGSGMHNVSDRLSTGEMYEWLYAFHKGIELGVELEVAAESKRHHERMIARHDKDKHLRDRVVESHEVVAHRPTCTNLGACQINGEVVYSFGGDKKIEHDPTTGGFLVRFFTDGLCVRQYECATKQEAERTI